MNRLLTLILVSLLMVVTYARAETVTIPVGQQAPELQGMSVPARGMTQAAVESKFGSPLAKSEPVGQPPISRWEYADYNVYFESDHVLHTVLKHKQ